MTEQSRATIGDAAAATPHLPLSDGSVIPQLGFGVWRMTEQQAESAVGQALDAGYRLIDTAAMYSNEAGVGRALRATADRGIPRDQVFVTTKLGNSDHGYDATMRAFDQSASQLGVEVVDLHLIHWPQPAHDLYVESFKAFLKLQAEGRIRSVGVSNFTPTHLLRLMDETGATPVLNQIELHPYLQQRALREFQAAHGIATQAWGPLAAGKTGLLQEPVILDVAGRNGVSPAQAVLAWHLAIGNVVIPKSVTPGRIIENLMATTVELPAEDLALINELDQDRRLGTHPDNKN